jgi:hypothetical protein
MKRWKTHTNALYRESTIALIRRIVENADSEALGVLVNTRKLFRFRGQNPILLSDFLLILRDKLAMQDGYTNYTCDLADCCYELTLAKYINFPSNPNKTKKSDEYSFFTMNVDCRNYYRAFLHNIQKVIDRGKSHTQLQAETNAGRILQNLVYKNFLHSKMECLRHTRFSIRYAWNVKGSVVYLWYPSYMTAKKFREWLEENVKHFDSKNPKEKERIQTLINKELEWGYNISMDECENFNALGVAMADDHSPIELNESIMFVNKLADDVVREKVRNIRRLRPGIKKLGAKTIETLILRIFSDLWQGDYKAARIAELYGISKATLSRFAGNNWFEKKRDNDDFQIPDLWRNTAGILAGNQEYMQIVLASGVAGKLEKILEYIEPLNKKTNVG